MEVRECMANAFAESWLWMGLCLMPALTCKRGKGVVITLIKEVLH